MITYGDFCRLRTDAQDCAGIDEFVAECCGSVPACYIRDDGSADDAIALLRRIWALRSGGVREIVTLSGVSQSAFSRRYAIPLRTLNNWIADLRAAPGYVISLIAVDVINTIELDPYAPAL